MRISMSAVAFLMSLAAAPSLCARDGLLLFVFGPGSAETARDDAKAAAKVSRNWLKEPRSGVVVRGAGRQQAVLLSLKMDPTAFDKAFEEAALQARLADPAAFLASMETAAQEAALHPGARILVAVLNSPPLSSDDEKRIGALIQWCGEKSVRVLVVDTYAGGRGAHNPVFEGLASGTGGLLLDRADKLQSGVDLAASIVNPPVQAPAAAPHSAAKSQPSAEAAESRFRIPVHMRFIRTSMKQSLSQGSVGALGYGTDTNQFAMLVERAYDPTQAFAPMSGFAIVDAPLNAVKFQTDEHAGTYRASLRVSAAIRNSKNIAVWTGGKDVNLRGPLRKLELRREGNLFFSPGVMLPGGDTYTLEATVKDLLSGDTGTYEAPLESEKGAPGLFASDALFVRPFNGSADRFEADEVFAYEGQALAPVLDPVFKAGEPLTAHLYFIIYPTIGGVEPEISFELQRAGQAVARRNLKFTNQVNNPALEGKFGTMEGKNRNIIGGRVREFPYLADLSGAKFPAGNYNAIVTIKQGKYIITRTVPFRVEGDSATMASSPGSGAGEVVLPEIAPASIDSGGLVMARSDQERIWAEAAANALGYSSRLPNFRCTQETHRFTAPIQNPGELKKVDSFKDDLIYEDGRERYHTVEINGAKADKTRRELKGVQSRGEFGSMLKGMFEAASEATYKWVGRAMAMGVLCDVFEVRIAADKSGLNLYYNGQPASAAYTGQVFIESETGLVRQLTIQGSGLPPEFPLQSPAFSLNYGMVRIGTEDFLLSLRSVMQVREMNKFVRNETVFRDYRKFDAESRVKFVQ